MSEYQRFGILEGKGHKKRTRGVRCGAYLGYNTLSKTSVWYKESLCEALQKTYLCYIELTLNKETKRIPIRRNYCLAAVLVVLSANAQDKKNNRPTSYNYMKGVESVQNEKTEETSWILQQRNEEPAGWIQFEWMSALIPYLNVSSVRTHVIFNNHFRSTC